MSQSESDEEVNRREVAYRLFAAEFDDADFSYAESDEERAPNYVVTPTGARANRVFVVGVLTEVEQVNDDVVRARVVDPTGAFVVYAGQYQPEALAALESADTPSFVAVTGKARTFEPDDSDVVYTSIRPETVSEVDAETRDRWVVTTAERTVDRVATAAAAHERVERGDSLQSVLERAGVHGSLASGIPRALDHYGTTPAYLAAVRDLAIGAARVVSGDAESAGELTVRPDQAGDAALDFAADLGVESAPEDEGAGETGEPASEPDATIEDAASESETEAAGETEPETEPGDEQEGDEPADPVEDDEPSPEPAAETPSPGEVAAEASPDGTDEASAEPAADESNSEEESADDPAAADADAGDGEMYELSEEERQEVEEEYDVGFSTGDEIPEAGEQDIDAPGPDEGIEPGEDGDAETVVASDGDGESGDDLGDFDAGDDEDVFSEDEAEGDEDDDLDDFTEDEYDEPESDAEDDESPPPDLDLEDYVVDLMDELDDGDGAPRDDVVTTAADDLDADEGEIEEAIQSALMSGRCYESGDDHLKAI
jgi:RPA family protein